MTFEEYAQKHLGTAGLSFESIELVRMGWNARGSHGNCQGILDSSASEVTITPEMIEAGAQRLVAWEDGSEWPDSWSPMVVAAARNDAERVLRSALNVRTDHIADDSKMVVNLKPIAESKVRQLGGDVCGVLVKNEAGAWAAVSEGGRVMWLDDFEPLPVARNEDVALPSHATKSDLIDCIDLMADEFKRIKALNPSDEISDLCDRALRVTEQNVPVLEVRDRLQKTVSKLLWKVSDLEDQLKAARAQGGQGAEAVAWEASALGGKRLFHDKAEAEMSAEVYGGGARPLVYGDTQPQTAVPEEWREVLAGCVTCFNCPEWSDKCEEYERRARELLSTPTTPQADGWVRCEDRLPTYRDSDEYGDVWAMSKLYGVKKMSWSSVRADFESHWMPTGLKRPDIPRC